MKGITLLAVASLLLAGCSKGGDTTASNGSSPGANSGPSATNNTPPGDKPAPSTAVASQTGNVANGKKQPEASGKPSTTSGAYTFKFAPEPGKLVYDTLRKEDRGDGKPQTSSSVMTTVTTKSADGTITIKSESTSVNGMPPVKTTQVLDSKGAVLKNLVDTGGGDRPSPNGVSVVNSFPDHSVNVGDTWTKTETYPQGTVVSVYKLVKVDGDVATLEVNRESKVPKAKVSSKSVIQLELSTGTPHSMNQDTVAENVPGPKGPITIRIHVEMHKQ